MAIVRHDTTPLRHNEIEDRERDYYVNNEADFKKAFCDSVAAAGGYTFKIAMSSMSGLPDIYCAMPGYIPLLLEAKYDKSVTEGKFKRKIKYRPFQREILNNCNKVYKDYTSSPKVAFCLMGLDLGNKKYCTLIDPELKEITHDLLIKESELAPIQKHSKDWFIDVDMLFINCGVPLLDTEKYSNQEVKMHIQP